MGIALHDHLIVAGTSCVGFKVLAICEIMALLRQSGA
jgi:hypothetical protein